MIDPSPGYALIIDELEETVSKSGIILHAEGFEKSKGCLARVQAINQTPRCAECGKKREPLPVDAGDTIVYSKFAAEPIDMKDDEGKPIKGIKILPVDSILAKVCS